MATHRARSAVGTEAVTPEMQAAAAARDGFVTYDELRGPDLDAARWSPARLPLPMGGEHIPLDPNSHRVRDLDDAADPGRWQSLDRRAGHDRAVAPVPCTRGRRVSRQEGRPR
jgi:hypothetical protein